MNYNLPQALEIIERTPLVLEMMLKNISDEWTHCNEGGETWSAFDIVGHLLHGDVTDWIPRLEMILSDAESRVFTKFDRFAQFEESKGKSMIQLLEEFKHARAKNMMSLKSKNITEKDLDKTATHPSLGEVTLRNLLSTWVAHDLNHIAQICRVMAKQYKTEVGVWAEYLRIINNEQLTINNLQK